MAATEKDTPAVDGTKHAEAIDDVKIEDESVAELDVPHEVAARSADMDKPSNDHRKAFVLVGVEHDDRNPYVSKDYDHEANKAATRQGAINAGLWPTGEVKLVSTKRHPDGISWVATYTVPVRPASDVPDAAPNPEVIADDTDKGGATKARNTTK